VLRKAFQNTVKAIEARNVVAGSTKAGTSSAARASS
jgi:hypothetical protein